MSEYIKVKLGDLIEERNERCSDPQESGYERFVGLEHMDTGRLEVKRYGSTDDVTTSCKLCHKGDMLFGRRNPYLRRAGVINFDSTCSGDIIVFRPSSDRIVPEYIPIVLATKQFWTAAMTDQGGTMSKRVHFEDFAQYEFDLPDLDTQRKLSELIWSYEKLICDCEEQLQNLDLLVKSRFIEMLNKTNIDYVKVKDLVRSDRPITYGIVKPGADTPNGIPLIRGKDYTSGKIEEASLFHVSAEIDSSYKRSKLETGDIIFAIRGSVGHSAIVPTALNGANITQDTARVSLKKEFNRNYVLAAFDSDYVQNQVKRLIRGATIKGINLEHFREILIPIPILSEQNRIASFIEQVDKSKFEPIHLYLYA